MRILILGGTLFLGRFLTEAALTRGDEITLFNRGKSNPGLFPEVERLTGDRNADLKMLRGRRWDVAIDTCAYTPRQVRLLMDVLAASIEHYTFVSSISVYKDYSQHPIREDAAVHQLSEESDQVTGENYGAQKAHSEAAAENALPGRVLVVRPGLIAGPYDVTERFTYWVRRIAAGGEVLAPGDPQRFVQLIDARDLAEWILRMAADRQTGIFNGTGPASPLTMSAMLNAVKEGTGSDAVFTWVEDDFLIKEQVGPWEPMPLWLPANMNMGGILDADVSKAVKAGLTFRPVAETARDICQWITETGGVTAPELLGIVGKAGISVEKEADVLKKWKQRA